MCACRPHIIVSRGRCGREIARLRRLAAVVTLRASCDFEATPPKMAERPTIFLRPAKQKTLRFLQRNGCEPACGHRGHCDFATRFLCRSCRPSGCRKRSGAKGVRSLLFRFRDAFGHFSVTFSDASVTFFVTFLPNSFCRTPFAAG